MTARRSVKCLLDFLRLTRIVVGVLYFQFAHLADGRRVIDRRTTKFMYSYKYREFLLFGELQKNCIIFIIITIIIIKSRAILIGITN